MGDRSVSETVWRGHEAALEADVPASGEAVSHARRHGWLAAGLLVVLAAGLVSAWHAGAFSSAASSTSGRAAPLATEPVLREDIAATTPVAATLGYAGSYAIAARGGGTLTELPQAGQVIRQGQVLYRTDNGSPVVLLYGTVPAWRALAEGVTGQDVSQLNHDLVALGYASRSDVAAAGWDYYSAGTASSVQRLEARLGVSSPPGTLPLGELVFEPAAIRVARVTGSLGGPASGQVLQATSDAHVVTIPLDVSQEDEVRAGDPVSVTLPDGTSTPAVVTSVGRVATTTSGQNGPVTTIQVQVKLSHPNAAGSLDQAPVTVYITTSTARDVLVVPVTALLARPGGYVVEVAGPGNFRRYVPVTVGPVFDDNSGLVQVGGALTPGQRVVVAAS